MVTAPTPIRKPTSSSTKTVPHLLHNGLSFCNYRSTSSIIPPDSLSSRRFVSTLIQLTAISVILISKTYYHVFIKHSPTTLCVLSLIAFMIPECIWDVMKTLQWRHNVRDGVSNHQPHDCLLNRLFRRRSEKTSNLRVTGFCEGNSPVTGEFPAQRASNAENVSIWWRHHEKRNLLLSQFPPFLK